MTMHADTSDASIEVVRLAAPDTHGLRAAVLRHDTPTDDVEFPEDLWPGVLHLGLRADGELVAVSTWVPRPAPAALALHDEGADSALNVQLRGMATARALQGHGLGGRLLEAGCAEMARQGAVLVWANARDAALAFYTRHAFEAKGDGFVEPITQLPHHVIVRRLTAG